MKIKLFLLLWLYLSVSIFSQDNDGLILGKTEKLTNAAIYDLSNPEGINIEVNLWGFVPFPGRYIVPVKTTFLDLMSFAGGPTGTSNLEEIRIIRYATKAGEKPKLIKLDYNDFLWDEQISTQNKNNPELQAGDVILVMEEKRYSFREDLSLYLPIISTLITITGFIITLTNK